METIRKKQSKLPLKDLKDFKLNGSGKHFNDRINTFSAFLEGIDAECHHTYGRLILSASDRHVIIKDPFTGKTRKMVMFASNNYLGFANHPYIKKRVKLAIDKYGVGIAGPPLLNGYSELMHEVEERLAALKHKEAAMIFPAGYSANLGILTALTSQQDCVIYDELSHASFLDGLRMARIDAVPFNHNQPDHFYGLFKELKDKYNNIFLGIEGVYSMDGDLAPLDRLIPFCRRNKIISILDDAHGTGVLGENGGGTAEHFNCCRNIDISMGTFSKAFAVSGGFVAADRSIIDFMKYFSRSYMFSASLPPVTLAAVSAGLDLIEKEPGLREKLYYNTRYAINKLKDFEFCHRPEAAIISIKIPPGIHLRKLNYALHQNGLFVNAIEYPAVPKDEQRLRVSIMVNHTEKDIDFLAEQLSAAFALQSIV
jgi:glycine C-acetyltransferase